MEMYEKDEAIVYSRKNKTCKKRKLNHNIAGVSAVNNIYMLTVNRNTGGY